MSDAIPVLTTDRLILRAFRKGDFDAFAAMWGDSRVVRYISGTPSSAGESWTRLLRLAGLWPLLGYGYWAVEERESGRLAGMAGVADFKREIDAGAAGLPESECLPEAGWVFGPDFHGRGYATEAMDAALAWADATLAADRTWCLIHPDNAASIRVAEKLGYGDPRRTPFGEGEVLVLVRARAASRPPAPNLSP